MSAAGSGPVHPTITAFDVDDATEDEFVDYHRLRLAVATADTPESPPPTFEGAVARLRAPMSALGPSRHWGARLDGRLVGVARLGLPVSENPHKGSTEIIVHPALRRHGIGTALLRRVLPALRAEERPMIDGWVIEGRPGEFWGRALGLRPVHRYVHHQLRLADVEPTRWEIDPPPGYRLEQWIGSAPERLLSSYAHARTAITDAPVGQADERFAVWTPALVRETEAEYRRTNGESWVVVAVHQETGSVAGLTELVLYPHRPGVALQLDTAVLAVHRGHGLGRWMKAAMLRRLRRERPDIERIYTNTSDTNVHMIRVNQQIGFVIFRSVVQFEDDVAELEARLSASAVP